MNGIRPLRKLGVDGALLWFFGAFLAGLVIPFGSLALARATANEAVGASELFGRGELLLVCAVSLSGTLVQVSSHQGTEGRTLRIFIGSIAATALALASVAWASVAALALEDRPFAEWVPIWGGAAAVVLSLVLGALATISLSEG